jgi:hypothetical protein
VAVIGVTRVAGEDPLEFAVEVREGKSATRHRVTMTRATHAALAGDADPATCIRAAFAFLLEREAKESILERFDVTVISRYFPEFADVFPSYLRQETIPPAR